MNKEVKELIEEIKGFGNCGFFTMTIEERDLLLDYINQLEINIVDAIGYIKYCQTCEEDIYPVIEAQKMIEILKGGSNE